VFELQKTQLKKEGREGRRERRRRREGGREQGRTIPILRI
jgi:hypothetical protein